MGIATAVTSSATITCDCCGYTKANAVKSDYAVLHLESASGLGPATIWVLCTLHGCDGLITELTSLMTSKRTAHLAAINAGVIPAHP